MRCSRPVISWARCSTISAPEDSKERVQDGTPPAGTDVGREPRLPQAAQVPALTPGIDVTAETKSKIANPSGAAAQSMRVDVRKLDEDVRMPVLDGIQALKQIMRESPRPVVMVSSFTLDGAQITLEALKAGAFDYLAKEDLSREAAALQLR